MKPNASVLIKTIRKGLQAPNFGDNYREALEALVMLEEMLDSLSRLTK